MTRKKDGRVKGAGEKEQRMCVHIEEEAEESGRHGNRAEEVAARTVIEPHKKEHHKEGE